MHQVRSDLRAVGKSIRTSELLIFLKVLRVAISSPVNWITCATVLAIFVIIASAPQPSLGYLAKPRVGDAVTALTLLVVPFFSLYLTTRLIIGIFRMSRNAIFSACALCALVEPLAAGRLVYEDLYQSVSARHSLVAILYNTDLAGRTNLDVSAAKLVDLGQACLIPPTAAMTAGWLLHRQSRMQTLLRISGIGIPSNRVLCSALCLRTSSMEKFQFSAYTNAYIRSSVTSIKDAETSEATRRRGRCAQDVTAVLSPPPQSPAP